MKKTLLDQTAKASILQRIDQLEPTATALWGKMNVGQMVCHCSDQFKMASGEIPIASKNSFLGKTLLRWAVLAGMSIPKGKVQTYPILDQVAKGGTSPTIFVADVQKLKVSIETFIARGEDFDWRPHPTFGKMSYANWAVLAYSHLDHHLSQFGA